MRRKTERRHHQGEQSRARILEATLEIATARGYDGTSVGSVTKQAGLPVSSLYWHFKNKDELLAETLEYSYQRWRATAPTWSQTVEHMELEQQIHTRLHRAGRALIDCPEFWQLGLMLAVEQRVVEPTAKRRFVEVREETQVAIEAWWKQILPDDVLRTDPVLSSRLARFHLAVMDGLFIGVKADRGWDVKALVDMLAAGMYSHVAARIDG